MWLFKTGSPTSQSDEGTTVPLLSEDQDLEGLEATVSPSAPPLTPSSYDRSRPHGAHGRGAPNPSAPTLADLAAAQSDAPSAPRLSDVEVDGSGRRASRVPVSGRVKLHRAREGQSRSSLSISSLKDFVDEHYSEGSIRGSVFNLCSATLGAGALSVPFAFRGMGAGIGCALLVLVAITTSFSVHLIIVTRIRSGLRTFGEIADGVFGNAVGNIVQSAIVIFCFGTGVAYCKTLRDILEISLRAMPKKVTDKVTDKEAMLMLWAVALMPLSLLKSMSSLRFSSLFGVASIMYVSLLVTIHSLDSLITHKVQPNWSDPKLWAVPNAGKIIMNLPILLFAFTCQVNVLDVWDDLSNASDRRMGKVTHRSMLLCLVVYVSVGLFGFLDFGSDTCGNILKSYVTELLQGSLTIVGMYISIAMTLLFAFPLIVVPCRSSLMGLCERLFGCGGGHVFWSIAVAGGAVGVSLWVEDVSQVRVLKSLLFV